MAEKKFRVGKIRNYEEYFEKITISSFKRASLPEWEGGKHAGGSRPSCFQLR